MNFSSPLALVVTASTSVLQIRVRGSAPGPSRGIFRYLIRIFSVYIMCNSTRAYFRADLKQKFKTKHADIMLFSTAQVKQKLLYILLNTRKPVH